MKNVLIAAIVACFLTACASENQEPQSHGKPLTGEIRMLPYRMSPEERERKALKREQEWRETARRNPACPDLLARYQESSRAFVDCYETTSDPIHAPECQDIGHRHHADQQALEKECHVPPLRHSWGLTDPSSPY